jgi:hypothetical protein
MDIVTQYLGSFESLPRFATPIVLDKFLHSLGPLFLT